MFQTHVRVPSALAALSVAVSALLLVLVGAAPASAHTELLDVTPAEGKKVVAVSPVTVSLTFTEAIDPALANLVVLDAEEQVVATQAVQVQGPVVATVTREVPEPGAYVIRYRVVSSDGHPVDGESRFTVAAPKPQPQPEPGEESTDAEPTGAATPEAEVTSAAAETTGEAAASDLTPASAESDDDSGSTPLVVTGLVVLVGILLLAGLLRRRASHPGAHGS